MACMNSTGQFGGGSSRQACPAPPIGDTPLTSQKSIYSLTLEEFQNTLGDPGKSFGSMNMEELLKNIWTAEEGQAMAAAMGTADVSGLHKQKSLQKQGSLSLKGALGRKTVDEIWTSVYQGPDIPADPSQLSMKQRELTFKEVTLEDFLVKAGLVPEEDVGRNVGAGGSFSFGGGVGMYRNGGAGFGGSVGTMPSNNMFSSPTSVLTGNMVESQQASQFDTSQSSFQPTNFLLSQRQNGGILQQGQFLKQSPTSAVGDVFGPSHGKQVDNVSLSVPPIGLGGLGPPVGGGIAASLNASTSYAGFNNLVVPAYKAESPLSSDGTGTSQGSMPLSPVYHSGMHAPTRKRLADGQLETVVERRQRRMIKNRESAARSRARKQAYTVELENELTELREENAKLKQKQENAERKLKKVLAVTQEPPKRPRALMRTRTGPW